MKLVTPPLQLLLLGVALCLTPGLNLAEYWQHNPLYGYGIWVPALALYLFWQRREALGALHPPRHSWLASVLIGAYLLSLPFLRVVQIANPDWRLLDALLSLGAFGSLLALFYRLGRWRLVKAFALPACFLLTAVPWSTGSEQAFISKAIPATGRVASELLWFFGIAAVDAAGTLHTAIGPIQVSEDCSGIRSFHLAIMVTVFWIGYFRMPGRKAAAMGLWAIGCTLLINTLRVAAIVALAVRGNQIALVEYWDYRMGTIAQAILVVVLPLVAWRLGKAGKPGDSSHPSHLPQSEQPGRPPMPPAISLPRWAGVSLLAWCLVVEVVGEGWFRWHESKESAESYWALNLHPTGLAPVTTPIPDPVKQNYFFSEGHRLVWKDQQNARWSILYLDFERGALSAFTHNIHRPEVCLPMSDYNLIKQFEPLPIQVADQEAFFAHQLFQKGTHPPVHLFHAYLQNCLEERQEGDWTYQGRLRAAWLGIRSHRAELVHLLAEFPYPEEEARRAAKDFLQRLLVHKAR